jgi:hypothetical protein
VILRWRAATVLVVASDRGRGYWATQFAVSLLLGIAGIVFGPVAMVMDEESPGRGLLYFLAGVAFLCAFFWLLREYRKAGREGRAVYAWAIMQQHQYTAVRNDAVVMSVAARARDGKLSLDELRALRALRPDSPYPGRWPTS